MLYELDEARGLRLGQQMAWKSAAGDLLLSCARAPVNTAIHGEQNRRTVG